MPLDIDCELVGPGHDPAGPYGKFAQRNARHVVHAEHLGNTEPLHQPVFHHHAPAAAALFGRLEDDDHGAVEIARFGQIPRRAQQHCGVPVMATGMHLASIARGIGFPGPLGNRQGVHVGPQPNHAI